MTLFGTIPTLNLPLFHVERNAVPDRDDAMNHTGERALGNAMSPEEHRVHEAFTIPMSKPCQ